MTVPVIDVGGASIPAIGLGTMTLKDRVCVEAVATALRQGYTSLDTAERYGNEEWVGEGLRASGVARDKVFVTTKVYVDQLGPADFDRSVDASLNKLQLSSVDLLLIHWPSATVPLSDQIASLCKAKRNGLAKHVGVANFTVALLDEAAKLTTEPLVTNQIEMHPFLDQSKVLAACKRHGLSVTAYCPIARGKVPGAEVLERIGQARGKSSAQVSLRWLTQQGIIPIPRSANPEHLKANLDVFDWSLSAAEMADIAALARPDGRVVNPPHHPQWDA
jgi:2,5-diketo-D-gluconate reductase B